MTPQQHADELLREWQRNRDERERSKQLVRVSNPVLRIKQQEQART